MKRKKLIKLIVPASIWTHENGCDYTVLYLANINAEKGKRRKFPIMVVYRGANGRVWTLSPKKFLRNRTCTSLPDVSQ